MQGDPIDPRPPIRFAPLFWPCDHLFQAPLTASAKKTFPVVFDVIRIQQAGRQVGHQGLPNLPLHERQLSQIQPPMERQEKGKKPSIRPLYYVTC